MRCGVLIWGVGRLLKLAEFFFLCEFADDHLGGFGLGLDVGGQDADATQLFFLILLLLEQLLVSHISTVLLLSICRWVGGLELVKCLAGFLGPARSG